jgi:hypothetical protein
VVLMYFFPMAFFFVAFYAEPLFLLTSVASMYFVRRGQFVAGGIAIALAGATRPIAFLLSVIYIIEFWQQRNFTRVKWIQFMLGASIAPTGMVAYLLSLAQQSEGGGLGAYTNVLGGWKTYTTWPWVTLFDGLNAAIFGKGITHDWFSRLLVWHDLLYAVLGLAVSIWALSRMRLSVSVFLLTSTLFLYTSHGPYGYAFWSVPRRVATMFPFYPALALVADQLPMRCRWLVMSVSMLLLGILSAWFASGRWIA